MSKAKHTPGPWVVVNIGTEAEPMMSVKASRISGRPPQHEVAICATGDSHQEMETANAHLIAAAPDMLEALEFVLQQRDGIGAHNCSGYDCAICTASWGILEKVVAKAKGEHTAESTEEVLLPKVGI